MGKYKAPLHHQLNPGHSACAGCGMIIAARILMDIAGKNTIVSNATGCSEVTTTQFPMSSFKMPWIHSLFENAAPVATGIQAALRYKKADNNTNIIAVGGDGATFDIGLIHLSGMWERGDNILYVCYDNEAYQNTGYQSSSSTPFDANTTTTPPGKDSNGAQQLKKDMIGIALAHHLPYVATASIAYPIDVELKIKKALSIKGPKYLQIHVPCVPGWGIEPNQTIKVGQLAVQSGIYPIVEYVNGQLVKVQKITQRVPAEEYLKIQKRFKHLFKKESSQQELAKIQVIADENIKKYGLV
ncbi:MAG: thiamine pyrophosphate-dependent enzyme [bacterium]